MTDLVLPSLAAYDVDVPPATAPVEIYKNISLPGHATLSQFLPQFIIKGKYEKDSCRADIFKLFRLMACQRKRSTGRLQPIIRRYKHRNVHHIAGL